MTQLRLRYSVFTHALLQSMNIVNYSIFVVHNHVVWFRGLYTNKHTTQGSTEVSLRSGLLYFASFQYTYTYNIEYKNEWQWLEFLTQLEVGSLIPPYRNLGQASSGSSALKIESYKFRELLSPPLAVSVNTLDMNVFVSPNYKVTPLRVSTVHLIVIVMS